MIDFVADVLLCISVLAMFDMILYIVLFMFGSAFMYILQNSGLPRCA